MNSFKNWEEILQRKFLLDNKDDPEKTNKIIFCFIFNIIQICKTYGFMDFTQNENEILSFFSLKLKENILSSELLIQLGLLEDDIHVILKFMENELTFPKAIHYLFLCLMEKHNFQKITNILHDDHIGKNYSDIVFNLKVYFQKHTVNVDLKKTKNTIDFILFSGWKPKSDVSVFDSSRATTYTIDHVEFDGNIDNFVVLSLKRNSESRTMSLRDGELNGFDSKTMVYKKYSFLIESSFCLELSPIIYKYLEFYNRIFDSLYDVKTHYSNKDLIVIFKLKLQLIFIEVKIQKQLLLSQEQLYRNSYVNISKKIRMLSTKKVLTYDNSLDFFYFFSGMNGKIKNIVDLPKEQTNYFFVDEIILNKTDLWIKAENDFYTKLDMTESRSDLAWYFDILKERNKMNKDYFLRGLTTCSVNQIDEKIKQYITYLLEKLNEYNWISFQHQNEKFMVYFNFPSCHFYLDKYNLCLDKISECYSYEISKERKKIYSQLNSQKKKKKINLTTGDVITFEEDFYLFNNKMISSVEEVKKLIDEKYNPNEMNLNMIFTTLEIPQNILSSYLDWIYHKLHRHEIMDSNTSFLNELKKNGFQPEKEMKEESSYYHEQKRIVSKMNKEHELFLNEQKMIHYLKSNQILQDFSNTFSFYE
jgi:hypothetical protein